MKRTVNVALGGRKFTLEEDAWAELDLYLEKLRQRYINMGEDPATIMDDVEIRIGEYLWEWRGSYQQVVQLEDILRVEKIMGKDTDPEMGQEQRQSVQPTRDGKRQLMRDTQHRVIGGVCSGLAHYFGMDLVLIRIISLVCLLALGASFWVYIILWIAVPAAQTEAQQLAMRGYALTPENLDLLRRGRI